MAQQEKTGKISDMNKYSCLHWDWNPEPLGYFCMQLLRGPGFESHLWQKNFSCLKICQFFLLCMGPFLPSYSHTLQKKLLIGINSCLDELVRFFWQYATLHQHVKCLLIFLINQSLHIKFSTGIWYEKEQKSTISSRQQKSLFNSACATTQ